MIFLDYRVEEDEEEEVVVVNCWKEKQMMMFLFLLLMVRPKWKEGGVYIHSISHDARPDRLFF